MTFLPVGVDLYNQETTGDVASTMVAVGTRHLNRAPHLLAFDPTQVTHPENRSSARGDSAALAKSARPPHIAYSISPEGGQGADLRAVEVDVAPSLTATAEARGTDRGLRVVCATGEQTHALRAERMDASEDGTGRGTPIVPAGWQVRRLTPIECERLQGFPDGYTDVPGASDSARYAALGNSMAVPVMRWLGERIARVDAIPSRPRSPPETGHKPNTPRRGR